MIKANPGESFADTAARETLEESGGLIDLRQSMIFKPSHDTLYLEEGLMLRRYRTYLAEVDYIDPTTLKDSEYTDYKWVPVMAILEALRTNVRVIEEGTPTIKLKDETILHPPLVDSLMQSTVQRWLNSLVTGVAIEDTCTQSLVGHPRLDFIEEEIDDSSASQRRFSLALSMMSLRRKAPTTPHRTLTNAVEGLLPPPPASYAILRHLSSHLGAQPNESLESIIEAVIKEKSFADQSSLIKQIISKEQTNKDMNVIYHGLQLDLWFVYRVLSNVRHMLNGTQPQTTVLGSLDSFFDEFSIPQELLNYVLKGSNNYSKGYKAAGISCNPSLFSSLDSDGSSTLEYFYTGFPTKPPQDPWQIIRILFDRLGLPKEIIMKRLEHIFNQHFIVVPIV